MFHTKDHLANFSEKKNGWWGQPLLPEILGQPTPIGAKAPTMNLIASAVTPSEKVQLTLIASFFYSLSIYNDPNTIIVRCP